MRLLLLIILLSALPIQAAIYFVDYQSGNDGNAGTGTSVPWKHCIGDTNATGLPAVLTLAAGDTVNFKAGTVYYGRIFINRSGGAGNPIIYDGQGWGSGARCYLTCSNDPTRLSAFTTQSIKRDNITIKNFDIADIGGYAENDPIWSTTTPVTNPVGGTGVGFSGGGRNIIIDNCKFNEIGQWRPIIPMSGVNSIEGIGVSFNDVTNGIVSNCEFIRMRQPVSIKSDCENILITNNIITNYVWGIDIAPNNASDVLKDIRIVKNSFSGAAIYDTPNWGGYGEKPHTDGMFIRNSGMGATWINVVVERCFFYDDMSSSGGTASIFISEGPSVRIQNCVFAKDPKADAEINIGFNSLSAYQKVEVYNCSFFSGFKAIRCSSFINEFRAYNNACYRNWNDPQAVVVEFDTSAQSTNVMWNYNVYMNDYVPLAGGTPFFTSGFRSLAQWNAIGFDTNSQFVDPIFVDTSVAGSLCNLAVQAGSPCIGTGTNLSAFFTTDYNGNTRTNWDIGAIAFGSAIPPAPPIPGGPGSLRITYGRFTSLRSIP